MGATPIDYQSQAKARRQICSFCKQPQEKGHYLRAYEKVGNVWKPTRNVCRFFHGEGAYKDAAQAKRKREDEAKARKVVARRSAREKKRRTTI